MKSRNNSFDCVKGIGIFLMVVGHAALPNILRQWIYGFHMPLFFILAGFMFNAEKWLKRGLGALMKSRAKAYLIPYLALFIINFVIYSVLQTIQSIGSPITTEELIKVGGGILRYVLAGLYSHDTNMPNCAPLWFLTCLFVSYLYFWFLMKTKYKSSRILKAIVYLAILFCVNQIEALVGIKQLPWHIDVALVASVFMLIGYDLRKYKDSFLQSRYCLLICMMCFIIGTVSSFLNKRIIMVINQYGFMVLFLVGATAMSIVVFGVSVRICSAHSRILKLFAKILGFWGRNTLIFIGFNYMINLVVRQFMKYFNLESTYLYSIVDIVSVMVGCSVIAFLWNEFQNKIGKRPEIV